MMLSTVLALPLALLPQALPAGAASPGMRGGPAVSAEPADAAAPRVELAAWSAPGARPPYAGARALALGDAPEVIWAGNARFSVHEELVLPAELRLELFEGGAFRPGWFLVHFDRSPTAEDKRLLDELSGAVAGPGGEPLARWYLPNRTLAVWVPAWTRWLDLAALPGVLGVRRYQPAYKLSPSIGTFPLSSPARRSDPRLRLDVDLIPGTDAAALAQQVAALGMEVEREVRLTTGGPFAVQFLVVWALPEQLVPLARLEGVRYVLESGDGLAVHDLSGGGKLQNRTLAADNGGAVPVVDAARFPLWVTEDLQGQGQVIGVVDTHVDPNNGPPAATFVCDGEGYPSAAIDNYGFADPVTPLLAVSGSGVSLKVPHVILRSGATLSSTLGPTGDSDHGTHVSASALADFFGDDDATWFEDDPDGWDGVVGDQYGLLGPGIAHEAQLCFAPVLDATNGFAWAFNFVGNMGLTIQDMADAGACVTVHSTGIVEADNEYTTLSVTHDTAAWSRPLTLQCIAAGNNGTGSGGGPLTSQGVVKNGLTVGASDDVLSPENRASFSSTGPRFDGALKPDVMVPGTDDTARTGTSIGSGLVLPGSNGSASTDPCTLVRTAGTSFAAPIAAGAATLVHQYFEEDRYPGAIPILAPSAALMKAVLVNAGHRLTGGNLGLGGLYPSGFQGWGEPNLSDALQFSGSARDLLAYDVPGGGPTPFAAASDAPWFFRFDVDGSVETLRATLAWTDEPGSTGTGKQLVNDLDLSLRAPSAGGFDWLGNVFDTATGLSQTGGTRDSLNNVENVRVAAPATGTWIARVAPTAGNFAAAQGFALVLTGQLTEVDFFQPATLALAQTPAFASPGTLAAQSDGSVERTVVAGFTLDVSAAEDVGAQSIALTFDGGFGAPDLSDLGPLELWHDTNADGLVDAASSPIATGALGSGTVTFTDTGSFPSLDAGTAVSFVVTVGVPPATSAAGLGGAGAAGSLGSAAALGAAGLLALFLLLRSSGRARVRRARALRPAFGLAGLALTGVVAASLFLGGGCGGGGGGSGLDDYELTLAASGFDLAGTDSLEAVAPTGSLVFGFSVQAFAP